MQIKELEQEVATYKSLNQKLQEQLAEKNQHMQRLEAENVVLSQKVEHSAHSSTGGTSLSRLVEGEISKSVQLERELSALKEKEVRT